MLGHGIGIDQLPVPIKPEGEDPVLPSGLH